jgi:hypothetical protein
MTDKIITDLPQIEQAFASDLSSRAAALVARWDRAGDPIDRWRQAQRKRRFIGPAKTGDNHRLGRQAETAVTTRLQAMGYQVHPTTHKCPFDLWVADGQGRAIRVEVKISLYHSAGRHGSRFQARIHNQADILIFIARNGTDWIYVIPMAAISSRKNIAIWSACPGDYTGQWAPYLNAWPQLIQAIQTAPARPYQPTLLQEESYA